MKELMVRHSKGVIEPLEQLDLKQGQEVVMQVREVSLNAASKDAFERAAGGWEGLLDFDAYLKDLYASQRIQDKERL